MTDKVVRLLQELIRNRCVNDGSEDSGNETRSAESLQNFFKSYNIDSEILEPRPGRGSLIVRVPGTDPHAPSLMILAHTDVVPVNPGEWSCDPFSGELRGDYVYGRGAVDMLNMTAAGAVAFAEAVKRHGSFPGDLVFLAEADEEASGQLGARWLVDNHWDKVKADYIITEGGGYFIQTPGGSSISIGVGEKGLAFTRLTTKGVSGHGSMPYKADSAVLKISRAIQGIVKLGNQTLFTPPYRAMIEGLKISSSLKCGLLNKWSLPGALKRLYKVNPGLAKQFHAISRMTMSPNVIRAGQKINIIPDKGEIELDIRILPEQTIEDVYREVKRALGKSLEDQFDIEIIDFFPSNVSSLETPLAGATYEIAGTIYPGVPFVPFLFSAVTDARFWRMKGSTVYGFSLFDESMTLTEYSKNIHCADERISVKSLELTANYFYRLPETFFRLAAHLS